MAARRFSRDRRHTKSIRYEGLLDVRGRHVSVAVDYPAPHLASLPLLYLTDRLRDLPDAVAHVEENERICYAREEELVLDPHNPRGSVALCMRKMQEALERIAGSDLQDEVAQEFPQHWQGASIYIDLPPEATEAFAFSVPRDGGDMIVVAHSAKRLRRMDLDDAQIRAAELTMIPVVLLRTEHTLTFSRAFRLPRVFAELAAWLRSMDESLPTTLIAGVARAWPKTSLFFLRGPNGTVGGKLVIPALLEKAVQRPQFLAQLLEKRAGEIALERLTGVSLDPSFVYHRNMADQPNLGGKKIALVGIGTVGGWLARFLAQSGAGTAGGRLILLDKQTLQPGNLGRHWLGIPYIGMNKAFATRKELARTNPDCDVAAITEDAFKHMSMLMDCHLVIDATGEQAVSDVLNADFVRARRERSTGPTSLNVWLVGSGVAARALIADRLEFACFRCLRLDHGIERFRLLKPDHPVTLTPANCGEGAYFAYGVGAPAIAAGLALQMSLDWVKGAPSPRHRTIRINQDATFQLKDMNASALENCPACTAAHV
jgi:hypothetical protein